LACISILLLLPSRARSRTDVFRGAATLALLGFPWLEESAKSQRLFSHTSE
jgi:hypothetical protein